MAEYSRARHVDAALLPGQTELAAEYRQQGGRLTEVSDFATNPFQTAQQVDTWRNRVSAVYPDMEGVWNSIIHNRRNAARRFFSHAVHQADLIAGE